MRRDALTLSLLVDSQRFLRVESPQTLARVALQRECGLRGGHVRRASSRRCAASQSAMHNDRVFTKERSCAARVTEEPRRRHESVGKHARHDPTDARRANTRGRNVANAALCAASLTLARGLSDSSRFASVASAALGAARFSLARSLSRASCSVARIATCLRSGGCRCVHWGSGCCN